MPVAAERGILGRAAEAIHTLVRGYSQEDINNLRRISSGEITDRDREEYKGERWCSLFSPVVLGADLQLPLVDPRGLMAAIKELKRLNSLSREQFNLEVQHNARLKAARWGLKLTV